jgi:excisionase family DNA binding protein
MSALNTQLHPNIPTDQVIVNHISIQAAAEVSGYNRQYLRRLMRAGKLDGIKVGQVWLIDLASLQAYFSSALSSNDLRCGPRGAFQPPF